MRKENKSPLEGKKEGEVFGSSPVGNRSVEMICRTKVTKVRNISKG